MNRYINANILIQDIERSRADNNHNNAIASQTHNAEHRHFIKMVLDQPTVDVVEVVYGHNIELSDFCCSVCGVRIEDARLLTIDEDGDEYLSVFDFKYCPNCGCKIDN